MTIARDLLNLVERAGLRYDLPPIRKFHVAHGPQHDSKNSNFGFVELEDGTIGLTYVGMGRTREDVVARLRERSFRGEPPLAMARLYAGDSDWQRALGMAAVNAVSQLVLKASGCPLPEMGHTVDLLGLERGDHAGMVGYFPPLVERIRTLDIPLTVIELDPRWLTREHGLEVTLDPAELAGCNKVLCTGTALVNHTLDGLLEHARAATQFCVIGPTASCLPGPLFERGVTVLCGCQVTDAERFIALWSSGQRWREATLRYALSPAAMGAALGP